MVVIWSSSIDFLQPCMSHAAQMRSGKGCRPAFADVGSALPDVVFLVRIGVDR